MNDLTIEVFTSPTCPHCPAAVKATETLVEENPELAKHITWSELSTATREGREKAVAYGIRGVPTIVVTNSKGQKGAHVGAPPRATYMKMIREMMK